MTEVVRHRSMQFRHLLLMLTQVHEVGRPILARDLLPSDASSGASSRASSGNRTVRCQVPRDDQFGQQSYGASGRGRWQNNQSFRQGSGNGPGHGVIVNQKVKASRVLSPLRRAGRLARAAHIFRRRSLRISRGQGKGARAIDPRPGLTTTTTGGQDGGRRLASHSTRCCRNNSSPLRDSVDEILDSRTNNLPVSPVRHGPSAAVAMCVATLSATQGVIRRALSPRRHRQLCLVKCVASLVAMRLAMEEMLVLCHLLFLLRP